MSIVYEVWQKRNERTRALTWSAQMYDGNFRTIKDCVKKEGEHASTPQDVAGSST